MIGAVTARGYRSSLSFGGPGLGFRRRRRVCQLLGKTRLYSTDGEERRETRLEVIIKRKKEKIQGMLDDLGEEALDDRLTSATMAGPGTNPFAFSQKISEVGMVEGRPLLIFEICREDPAETSESLAQRAKAWVDGGADALCVRIDEESTPQGEMDLFMVSKACPNVPIFCRDWFLHPLQIVDAKSAGATGILGITASVLSKGSAVMSSFGAALGLDCPVEVVNLNEMKSLEAYGVPFFCMDISVSISIGIQGFGQDIVKGVLGELPFGAVSIVGIRNIEDARGAREAGADALYIRNDIVERHGGDEFSLVSSIKAMVDGD
jgi:indole-3-glycerol phosphate synthase